MSWIKLRKDLFGDPSVIAIAARLEIDECYVVGMLARVWSWADDVTGASRFGHVPTVTRAYLDRLVSVTGFGDAMISAGWLEEDETGITFPHFDRHMSKTAKERCQAQFRKSQSRSRHGAVTEASRSKRDIPVTREEKRREEKKNTSPPPPFSPDEAEKTTKAKQEVIDAWNALGKPFSKVMRLGDGPRAKALKARLATPWWAEHWREGLAKIPGIPGLRGEAGDDRHWVADFDWFVRADTVAKLLEGKYDQWGQPDDDWLKVGEAEPSAVEGGDTW